MSAKYASVAVLNLTSNSQVAIAAISVTSNEAVLSGAWVIRLESTDDISTVLSGKLVIPLSKEAEEVLDPKNYGYSKVSLSDFFAEAKRDARASLESFEAFQTGDIKKRKNLVRPHFFPWNEVPALSKSWEALDQFGLPSNNEDCAPEMREALGAARLVQYFISQWQNDERARSGRRYLDDDEIDTTILPKAWLN